ncbi:ATP-binding cassette domain-containing protein [Culicoidibacter larvae]|uniref:ABC transporter ATP-binding protein n=1 Tax=Culicoidibacter larvae TaxID=2579976 RepID=A0A5R8Q8C2_9FIRM|nr:ABC transporter ATP-binding protein [Culicoidibacter larvae]TLG70304.1 ABC transporter ATP-binding protein [Culicoidibacter larvae]
MKIQTSKLGLVNNKFVMDNINLTFKSGQFNLIIGKNGSGKTQLLNALAGINTNITGEISFVTDNDNKSTKRKDVAKKYNYISAHVRNLFNELTGFENCMFFAHLYGINKNEASEKIYKLAEYFTLTEDLNKKVGEYSNGMMQRLHFIRAFLNEPEIIFLDEPTTGLDIHQILKLYKFLQHQKNTHNVNIICIAHDLEMVEQFADSICLIEQGEVIWQKDIKAVHDDYNTNCFYVDLEQAHMSKVMELLDEQKIKWYSETPEDGILVRLILDSKLDFTDNLILQMGEKERTLKDILLFRE